MRGVCRAQSHPAAIQTRRFCWSPIDARSLQALPNNAQEDAQRHVEWRPVTLHQVAKTFRHLSSTHWRTGRRGKTRSRRCAAVSTALAYRTRGSRPGLCRRRRQSSRGHSHNSGRGQRSRLFEPYSHRPSVEYTKRNFESPISPRDGAFRPARVSATISGPPVDVPK